jgi:hypothetical protein
MRQFVIGFAFIAACSLVLGRDITTKTGATYKNITINRIEAAGISVTHSTGVAFLECPVLPDDLQREVGCTAEGYAAGKIALEQRDKAVAEYLARIYAEVAERTAESNRQIAAAERRRSESNAATTSIVERDYSTVTFATPRLTGDRYSNRNYGGGPVQVRGYTRKDGTYVRPHTRSAPRR